MSLCDQIDDTKEANINWKGIFSYVQALQTNKDKENEILRYANYFLLAKKIVNKNYLALYMKVFAQLSFNYYKTQNENGFKWLYFSIKRMNIQNDNEYKGKIYFNYAKYLSEQQKELHFALELIKEVKDVKWASQQNEKLVNDLQTELQNKIKECNLNNNSNNNYYYNYEDDCWNIYYNDDNDMSLQKKESLQQYKIKVLILSQNNQDKYQIPLLPRYIYWNTREELKKIKQYFISNDEEESCYEYDDNNKREHLLYIIHHYLTNKTIPLETKHSFKRLTKEHSSNQNRIIIITSKAQNINVEKIYSSPSQIPIPNELKPFIDFAQIISLLKANNYIYKGEPFENFGNTCYLNASMQCILHCNILTSYYYNDIYKRYLSSSSDLNYQTILNHAFAELINNFSQKQLKIFVKTFINEDSKFYLGEQHDSPEFISDCLNNLGYGTSRKCYEYYDTTIEDDKCKLSWNRLLQKETSIITDLFYGQLKHESICLNSSCNNKNIFYEEYLLLDIPIPKKGATFKLFTVGDYTNYKEVYIEYPPSDNEMTVKHVKECVRNKYDIHVDIVQLTQNEITVLTKDDEILEINKYNEFVLYEIKNKDIRRCYIVKCKKRNKSNSWFGCCCKGKGNYIESFIEYPTLEFENNNENIQKINFNPNIEEPKEALIVGKDNSDCVITVNDYYIRVNSSQDEYQKIQNKNDVFHESQNEIHILYQFKNNNSKRLNIEPNNNGKLNLDLCFDLFKNSTTKVKCKTCQHNCKMKTSFTKLPHYLIIYFKRFTLATNSSFKKRYELIDFPEELTLNEDNNNNDVTYKAFSIIYHYGNISSGHYTALCKEGNTWYYYDDSRYPKKTTFNVSGNELLVFYEKH